jgi:hypothetical protein
MGFYGRLQLPDYKNNLVNIPNSILRWEGMPTSGASLPLLDDVLSKNDYKNVVFLILDGMGSFILDESLNASGFFRSHRQTDLSSVFLATTVAATTSAITGLQPCGHAWLGWDCYYPSVNANVTVFLNRLQGTTKEAAPYDVATTFAPYESVVSIINKTGGKAFQSYPFAPPYPSTIEAVCDRIVDLCSKRGKKYIYAYTDQPDSCLHQFGRLSGSVISELRHLEQVVSNMATKLKDTLLIITADHGHISCEKKYLYDYPHIEECLVRAPSFEQRVLNLFVKDGKEQAFEDRFYDAFGDDFLLLPMQKALDMKLFGTDVEHERFRSMLGNYIAISASNASIHLSQDGLVSLHGSLTPDEITIPLILCDC